MSQYDSISLKLRNPPTCDTTIQSWWKITRTAYHVWKVFKNTKNAFPFMAIGSIQQCRYRASLPPLIWQWQNSLPPWVDASRGCDVQMRGDVASSASRCNCTRSACVRARAGFAWGSRAAALPTRMRGWCVPAVRKRFRQTLALSRLPLQPRQARRRDALESRIRW